jgi:hypothetical protein
MGQSPSLAYCFLNSTQLVKHTCIESYPRPNSFIRFFASLYDLGSVLHIPEILQYCGKNRIAYPI